MFTDQSGENIERRRSSSEDGFFCMPDNVWEDPANVFARAADFLMIRLEKINSFLLVAALIELRVVKGY